MKKILLFAVTVMVTASLSAQQDEQFSQNMHNRLYPNPAVAGSNNAICATLLGRHQWMGFDGKPESYLLSAHMPFQLLGQSWGAGLSVKSDKLGQENTIGAKAALAYRRGLGMGDISIGLSLGMINKSIGNNWKSVDDYQLDAAINDQRASKTAFDMDLGLYYKTDKLYIGLSSLHLPSSTIKDASTGSGAVPDDFKYKVARHYYVMAGYDYALTGLPLTLQPSVFVKSDASSTQIDVNFNVLYDNLVWAGVSYRVNDAVVPMIGVMKENIANGTIKFGYSYDVTTSLLKQYSSGSHEIMLGYCFNLPDKTKVQKHKTVRFL